MFLLQHQLFVYYIVLILHLVELLLMKYSKVVPGATIYQITIFYLNINYGILSFNTTSISTFSATFVSEI